MDNTTQTAIAPLAIEKPAFSVLLKPVANNEEILRAWATYNELKTRLLDETDFCEVSGQSYPRKSAFRKLALAFGISVEIVDEKRLDLGGNVVAYEITAKATSPNGRYMTAVGSAHSNEKKYAKQSDVRAIGQTRATNRAVSDLIGGVLGVSAEEVISESTVESQYVPFKSETPKPSPRVYDQAVTDIFDNVSHNQVAEEPASEKQKNLIISLVDQRIQDEATRAVYLNDLGGLSKFGASDRIKQLLGA